MDDPRKHPDLFTPEEAAEYLHLPSVETLKTLREKKVLVGFPDWTRYTIYHREDLDDCAARMCGRTPAPRMKLRQA